MFPSTIKNTILSSLQYGRSWPQLAHATAINGSDILIRLLGSTTLVAYPDQKIGKGADNSIHSARATYR